MICKPNTLLLTVLTLLILVGPLSASEPNSFILNVGGSSIGASLPEVPGRLSRQELLNWVETSALTVSRYYGRFPVPDLTLRVRGSDGSGIRHGVTYPQGGGLILISVGRDTDISETKDDWVLVHEMIHLAFPSMDDDHHWLEEGISTYVEPVARAQAGLMSEAEVWKEFIRDMPKGEPQPGDHGLDNTHTWGRTYWGGALFCLLADIRIREHTGNRKGLQDGLRGILNAGGKITEDWEIGKTLAIGDKAAGSHVLQDLYREMRDKPKAIDLNQIWQKLGVELKDGTVRFNDKAPEADIRKAITHAIS